MSACRSKMPFLPYGTEDVDGLDEDASCESYRVGIPTSEPRMPSECPE